jgi:hypothetical protein
MSEMDQTEPRTFVAGTAELVSIADAGEATAAIDGSAASTQAVCCGIPLLHALGPMSLLSDTTPQPNERRLVWVKSRPRATGRVESASPR